MDNEHNGPPFFLPKKARRKGQERHVEKAKKDSRSAIAHNHCKGGVGVEVSGKLDFKKVVHCTCEECYRFPDGLRLLISLQKEEVLVHASSLPEILERHAGNEVIFTHAL